MDTQPPCKGKHAKKVPANGRAARPFTVVPLAIYTKVTKGTGPVRRLGKIEHGTFWHSRAGLLICTSETAVGFTPYFGEEIRLGKQTRSA